MITTANIVPFISHLYWEKYKNPPPTNLLDSWREVPEYDLIENLEALFAKWGRSPAELQSAIYDFELKGMPVAPPVTPPTPAYHPPPISRPLQTTPPTLAPVSPSAPYPPPPPRPRRKTPVVLAISILLILAAGAYVAYEYYLYTSAGRVYCITDNVALRDATGKVAGRMDLFGDRGNETKGSYSNLRAMDRKIHDLVVPELNESYPTLKVMEDDAAFSDFLFRKSEIERYVNVNFVVRDETEYKLYTTIFAETNNVPQDNKNLKAVLRKVIVGSMAMAPSLQNNFITTNSARLSKGTLNVTTNMVMQELVANKTYAIIAGLSDGFYYRFEGDASEDNFVAPIRVKMLSGPNDQGQTELQGQYRFINSGGTTKLYDVDSRTITNYELVKDDKGKILDFKYVAPPLPTFNFWQDTTAVVAPVAAPVP